MDTESTLPSHAESAREWLLIDAEGQTVGRLASEIAHLLRGKHKVYFSQHVDCGDRVVVVNAGRVVFKGKKMQNKLYQHHTGWVGGVVTRTAEELIARDPTAVITLAVRRMLPKNRLGRGMLRKLKVYATGHHPHVAQKVQPFAVGQKRRAPLHEKVAP